LLSDAAGRNNDTRRENSARSYRREKDGRKSRGKSVRKQTKIRERSKPLKEYFLERWSDNPSKVSRIFIDNTREKPHIGTFANVHFQTLAKLITPCRWSYATENFTRKRKSNENEEKMTMKPQERRADQERRDGGNVSLSDCFSFFLLGRKLSLSPLRSSAAGRKLSSPTCGQPLPGKGPCTGHPAARISVIVPPVLFFQVLFPFDSCLFFFLDISLSLSLYFPRILPLY
jgi:hypothetical protein